MSFRKEKIKDYFLLDTNVENMFINEYMVSAPGDFVKVYLFALMYCNLGSEFTNEDIAKHLNLDYEDVLKAWTYWEKMGVIRKIKDDPEDNDVFGTEQIFKCAGSVFAPAQRCTVGKQEDCDCDKDGTKPAEYRRECLRNKRRTGGGTDHRTRFQINQTR